MSNSQRHDPRDWGGGSYRLPEMQQQRRRRLPSRLLLALLLGGVATWTVISNGWWPQALTLLVPPVEGQR